LAKSECCIRAYYKIAT